MGFLRKHSIIFGYPCVNFFLGRGGLINQPMWILEGRQPSEAAGGGFGEGFSRHQVFVFLFLGACRPVFCGTTVVDVLNFVGCQTAKRQPPKDWHPGIPYECWGMPKPMDRILKITSRQPYPCQMNGVEHRMSKQTKKKGTSSEPNFSGGWFCWVINFVKIV